MLPSCPLANASVLTFSIWLSMPCHSTIIPCCTESTEGRAIRCRKQTYCEWHGKDMSTGCGESWVVKEQTGFWPSARRLMRREFTFRPRARLMKPTVCYLRGERRVGGFSE